MIELILPSSVSSADTRIFKESLLWAEEQSNIATVAVKRRIEHTTGRRCARIALSRLGVIPKPIPRGPNGEPIWPAGIIGSITHSLTYCAAAVGLAHDWEAIGIDTEPHEPMKDFVSKFILSEDEERTARRLMAEYPDIYWDRIIFSAKESVFKALFPLSLPRLSLRNIEVRIERKMNLPAGVEFQPTQTCEFGEFRSNPSGLKGRWAVIDDTILTSAFIESSRVFID